MYRVEDKYYLSDGEMIRLESRLGNVLASDHEESYTVSSLYFDDLSKNCYKDSLNGNPFRIKYRLRIYNNSLDCIKMEIKQKKYNRVKKLSTTISKEELSQLLYGKWRMSDSEGNGVRQQYYLAQQTRILKPEVIVTYERKAFFYDSGNVRITLDRNLRGCNCTELFGRKSLVYDYPEMEYHNVLEVKYDEVLPGFLAQLLELGNLQQTANSKYVICRNMYENRRDFDVC